MKILKTEGGCRGTESVLTLVTYAGLHRCVSGVTRISKTNQRAFTAEDVKGAEEGKGHTKNLNHTFATLSAGSRHEGTQRAARRRPVATNSRESTRMKILEMGGSAD
jgi:hypothetical protein